MHQRCCHSFCTYISQPDDPFLCLPSISPIEEVYSKNSFQKSLSCLSSSKREEKRKENLLREKERDVPMDVVYILLFSSILPIISYTLCSFRNGLRRQGKNKISFQRWKIGMQGKWCPPWISCSERMVSNGCLMPHTACSPLHRAFFLPDFSSWWNAEICHGYVCRSVSRLSCRQNPCYSFNGSVKILSRVMSSLMTDVLCIALQGKPSQQLFLSFNSHVNRRGDVFTESLAQLGLLIWRSLVLPVLTLSVVSVSLLASLSHRVSSRFPEKKPLIFDTPWLFFPRDSNHPLVFFPQVLSTCK